MTTDEELRELKQILATGQTRIQARARRLASAFAARAAQKPAPKPVANETATSPQKSKFA